MSTAEKFQSSHSDCVNVLANKAIRPGAVVIDLGAGSGLWTQTVLSTISGVEVHCFEPDPVRYRQLLLNLANEISTGKVVPHNASVGWEIAGIPAWNSLPQYAKAVGLSRLPFVRLGAAVPGSAVFNGCSDLLRHGHIEFILATADAQQEAVLAQTLLPQRYELFRHPALGDQVLCVSDRFRATIKNQPPAMPDVLQLCEEFGITPKGVIHVGAHEGLEAKQYVSANVAKTLMVEANPAVYATLQNNVLGLRGVTTINCAASEQSGFVQLHVTSMDQSSSILPLARHSVIYPSVQQVSTVMVPAKTIDQIVREMGDNPGDFNLLNLDIQGAELMALRGAIGLLPSVQAILTEVNYEELYGGCAMIEELDSFLESHGFDRVATATPHHPSWGDAFYVRRRPASVPQQTKNELLYEGRNSLVGGWLSLAASSLREAWEGATGVAHRHLIDLGVCRLPLSSSEDHRVLELLEKNLPVAAKDRRVQLLMALMLYRPIDQIQISPEGLPGWLKKSLPGLGTAAAPAMAA